MAPLFALLRPFQDVEDRVLRIVSVRDADVRETIRLLMREVGASYTISPEVQGTVSVSLRNVRFGAALENVVRQVSAKVHVEAGVYQIVYRYEAPFREQAEIDRAYVRLRDLARKEKGLVAWLGPRFALFEGKAMRQGPVAAHAIAETERTNPHRSVWITHVEPPAERQSPGLDRYATVEAGYRNGGSFVDTWRRPPKGEWRLLSRRTRIERA